MAFTITAFDIYGNALWEGGAHFLVNVTDRFIGNFQFMIDLSSCLRWRAQAMMRGDK